MKAKGLILVILVFLIAGRVVGQDSGESAPLETGVWVTTQDFTALRAGPGRAFERIAVLDPALTLPAIGRSADGEWVQVANGDQRGWVYYTLLVWSGDLVQLPVDGVEPLPFVRVLRNRVFVPAGTPLYFRQVTPEDYCCTTESETFAEITGYLGQGRDYWIQLNFDGTLYWTGAWALGLTGLGQGTFDTSYLYGYSRIIDTLYRDSRAIGRRLDTIEGIWQRLANGESVSCGVVPAFGEVSRTLDADSANYPIFLPVVRGLRDVNDQVNRAIAVFADACSRPPEQFFITPTEVSTALATLETARRDFLLVDVLLDPLNRRDPINEMLAGDNR